MDWNTMCKIEPMLDTLQHYADMMMYEKNDPYYWRKYENVKSQMKTLVGYYAKNEKLATRECFDIAHDNIFRVMK